MASIYLRFSMAEVANVPKINLKSIMNLVVETLDIPEIKLIRPKKFRDDRGFFSEVYSKRALADVGIEIDFIQDNHSHSAQAGVLRGLHFQVPPAEQAKLVRVISGRIWDVVVDVRAGSPTYGRWVGAELSAENWTQILVPHGFAHGFITLEPHTEVLYKVDAAYDPAADGGLIWNDLELSIDWPLEGEPKLSSKDKGLPRFTDWLSPFSWQEQVR